MLSLGLLLTAATTVSIEMAEADNVADIRAELGRAFSDAVSGHMGDDVQLSVVEEPSAACKNEQDCRAKLVDSEARVLLLRILGGPTEVHALVEIYSRHDAPRTTTIVLPRNAPEQWRRILGPSLSPLLPQAVVTIPSQPTIFEPEEDQSIAPYALLGVAAISAGIGIGFSAGYSSAKDDLLENRHFASEHDGLVSDANLLATGAIISLGVAAVSLATSAGWILLDP